MFLKANFYILPVCPLYALLHVLHEISYTPLLSNLLPKMCCSFIYCDMIFMGLNAMCVCVPLFVFLIVGLTYVKVTHCWVIFSCGGFLC